MTIPAASKIPHDAIIAERCRRSFFYFLKTFWHVVIPEQPVYNWHMEYLCNTLQEVVERVARREPKLYDVAINIPPGTSKSTICTVMLPVWAWIKDPRMRALTASYSNTLSVDHSVKSRDVIRSDIFRRLFPDVSIRKDFDNKSHYKNEQGGERLATSVTGKITGFHGHLLIVDDPLNPKEASSDVERLRASEFMNITLSTRKIDKSVTPTILVMQRLHKDDPTGDWLKRRNPEELMHICLPAEVDDNIKPPSLKANYVDGLLDPKRLTHKNLEEFRRILGSYGYAGQMLQRPAPPEGGIWKKWLKPIALKDIPHQHFEALGTDWDLAYTEKEHNSASAYVTAAKVGNAMYVIDAGYRHLEFPALIEYMTRKQEPHYIEAKASGKSAAQTLTNRGIPAIEVEVQGGDKIGRAMLATPYAESGMIYVREDLLEMLYNDAAQGILMFPNNSGDDLQDAFVQAINRLLGQPQVLIF